MKSIVPYLVVAVLAAAVTILAMRGCSNITSPPPGRTAVDSAVKADAAYAKAQNETISRLRADSSDKADIIEQDESQINWYQVQLSTDAGAIDGTLQSYDNAKVVHDTVKIVQSCDTLAREVVAAKSAVKDYMDANDSLVSAFIQQGEIKDSISRTWQDAFLHADSSRSFLQAKYDTLYNDDVKKTRKLKISSVTGKIGWGAALVFFLGLLIKK